MGYPKAKEWGCERAESLFIETTIEIVKQLIGKREHRYQLHYFLDLNSKKEDSK